MASNSRLSADDAHRARETARERTRHLLSADPTLPRALVELVLAGGDPASARAPGRRADAAPADRGRPALPHRLPAAIAAEMPPNILYRRYPLVTSLLVELDDLRRVAPSPRRRR